MTEPSKPPSGGRVELNRRHRPPLEIHIKGWYPVVVMASVMIVLTLLNVVYTVHVDRKRQASEGRARAAVVASERELDRRWCKLLVPLDDSYQKDPRVQQSELGKRVAAAIHEIRAETGC